MLWSGVADLIFEGGYDRLIGCASIDVGEGFGAVRALVDQILARHLAREERRALPKIPLPAAAAAPPPPAPPLLKAYLQAGRPDLRRQPSTTPTSPAPTCWCWSTASASTCATPGTSSRLPELAAG